MVVLYHDLQKKSRVKEKSRIFQGGNTKKGRRLHIFKFYSPVQSGKSRERLISESVISLGQRNKKIQTNFK